MQNNFYEVLDALRDVLDLDKCADVNGGDGKTLSLLHPTFLTVDDGTCIKTIVLKSPFMGWDIVIKGNIEQGESPIIFKNIKFLKLSTLFNSDETNTMFNCDFSDSVCIGNSIIRGKRTKIRSKDKTILHRVQIRDLAESSMDCVSLELNESQVLGGFFKSSAVVGNGSRFFNCSVVIGSMRSDGIAFVKCIVSIGSWWLHQEKTFMYFLDWVDSLLVDNIDFRFKREGSGVPDRNVRIKMDAGDAKNTSYTLPFNLFKKEFIELNVMMDDHTRSLFFIGTGDGDKAFENFNVFKLLFGPKHMIRAWKNISRKIEHNGVMLDTAKMISKTVSDNKEVDFGEVRSFIYERIDYYLKQCSHYLKDVDPNEFRLKHGTRRMT